MNIYTFVEEYHNLSKGRKIAFYRKVFDHLIKEIENEGDSILLEEEFLPSILEAEENDYFGTEGFRED